MSDRGILEGGRQELLTDARGAGAIICFAGPVVLEGSFGVA